MMAFHQLIMKAILSDFRKNQTDLFTKSIAKYRSD